MYRNLKNNKLILVIYKYTYILYHVNNKQNQYYKELTIELLC